MVVAPALSGVLISVAGLQAAFGIDAATYAVSLAGLWLLGASARPW